MGMKLKSGADLCGFQLTNFCVQGEASAPSDAALGRKYFHTNATDDVATGISLLNRERIYLGEGAWRATAYLDDIAAINEKLNLITGDTDTDTLINNLKDLEEFLKDFSETDKLKSLLDGKLDKSGGTIEGTNTSPLIINTSATTEVGLRFNMNEKSVAWVGYTPNTGTYLYSYGTGSGTHKLGLSDAGVGFLDSNTLIHSGNIGSQKVASAKEVITSDGINALAGDATTLRVGYGYRNLTTNIYGNEIYFAKNGNISMLINSSGNVTIGGSDLAETSAKLYVDGGSLRAFNFNSDHAGGPIIKLLHNNNAFSWWGYSPNLKGVFLFNKNDKGILINDNDNVLIGTTTDDENKLQVMGGASFRSATNWQNERTVLNYAGLKLYARDTGGYNQSISFLNYDGTIFAGLFARGRRSLVVGTGEYDPWVTFAPDGIHIVGNLIVDGEISAGGAGTEEGTSGSGSAEGVSEIFTPTSTSMAFDHNLGEDVIVQVYEKNNSVWNLVMVDVEITSATRVTLRFGKTETTQHKVVIMGV